MRDSAAPISSSKAGCHWSGASTTPSIELNNPAVTLRIVLVLSVRVPVRVPVRILWVPTVCRALLQRLRTDPAVSTGRPRPFKEAPTMPQYVLSVWHDDDYDDLDFSSADVQRR